MNHKQWLDNEYSEWVKALQESTVHNFKEHPGVKRMLGELSDLQYVTWFDPATIPAEVGGTIVTIDNIGRGEHRMPDGRCYRYCYYANEIIKRNPSSICEIGGGVGQLNAIVAALGYKGEYFMIDLPEVIDFQTKYLSEVKRVTGLNTYMMTSDRKVYDFICSFYALGEFDDETKESYRELLNNAKHGYIAFNPHSGASDDLSLFKHDIKVTDGIEPGIKIVEW